MGRHGNDRAALFSAGSWSTVITGFAFNGADSLQCFIGPGSYSCGAALASGLFANPPTVANPLILCGCDSSGVLLTIPDPNWKSCQPAWDASTLPVIATTGNIATISLSTAILFLIKLTASARNSSVVSSAGQFDWCVVSNSQSNTAAVAFAASFATNCVFTCSGSSFDTVANAPTTLVNCRVEGVAGSSGNRRGVTANATTTTLVDCTVVNSGGEGIIVTTTNVAQNLKISRCVIANNGATGLKANSTASQTTLHETHRCMVTGNGTAGIDGNSAAARWLVEQNRLRDNTTNITGLGNYPIDLNNYTTDSDDATEYVSTGANGDFSIKNTASAIWGKGFGVRDQPAAGGAAELVNAGALVG